MWSSPKGSLHSEIYVKKIILHPKILPSVVICEVESTVGRPGAITAATGMDAFAHCLAACSSPHFHPMSPGVALEGLRLVNKYLPRANADRGDIDARGQMMASSSMGAVAFQKGLGRHSLFPPYQSPLRHHGPRTPS